MDYYKDTPPLEFIKDLYNIMKDNDGLRLGTLVADVVNMLEKYLAAQRVV